MNYSVKVYYRGHARASKWRWCQETHRLWIEHNFRNSSSRVLNFFTKMCAAITAEERIGGIADAQDNLEAIR
jgi:hypothetical protein